MATIVIKDKQPRYRSKVTGRERVFLVGKEICNSKYLKADVVTYLPDAKGGEHYHKSESFIYVIDGECEISINGVNHKLQKETMVYLDPGDKHYIRNTGKSKNMVMLEGFAPQSDSESIWTDPMAEHGWVKVGSKSS